jgi:DNA-binding CsgD family transcriptional regulator
MDSVRLAQCADIAHCVAEGVPVLDQLLELLDRTVGADVISASALRLGELPQAEVALRGASPMTAEEMRLWPQLLPTHPYVDRLQRGPEQASRSSDAVPLRDLQRLDVYDLLLRPRGSTYQAGLLLERTPTSMLLVSLWRPTVDFSDRELEVLETLRRPVAAATAYRSALDWLLAAAGHPANGTVLTVRQREVTALVARGLTNEQVARRLGIAPRTVRKHLDDAWARTGTTSRASLAAWWAGAEVSRSRDGAGRAATPA